MRMPFDKLVVLCLLLIFASSSSARAQDDATEQGLKAIRAGNPDLAIAIFSQQIASGGEGSAYINRGWAYMTKGDYARAISDYNTALASNLTTEDRAIAYHNRACVYRTQRDYSKAIADWRRSLQLNPNHAEANLCIADTLACSPDEKDRDPKLAWQYASRALQLVDPVPGNYYGVLAEAYAANGDWDHAVEYAKKALESNSDPSNGPQARENLRLFEQHKPYLLPAKEETKESR